MRSGTAQNTALPPRPALAAVIATLGDDEVAVLLVLAKRLATGQQEYGRLNLRRDRRQWRREAAEEAADLLAYLAFDLVRRELAPRPRRRRGGSR